MLRHVLMLAASVGIGIAPAKAQETGADFRYFMSGETLQTVCTLNSPKVDMGRCAGYISGVVDAHITLVTFDKQRCLFQIPSGTRVADLILATLEQLERSPDGLKTIAAISVLSGMTTKFGPCK